MSRKLSAVYTRKRRLNAGTSHPRRLDKRFHTGGGKRTTLGRYRERSIQEKKQKIRRIGTFPNSFAVDRSARKKCRDRAPPTEQRSNFLKRAEKCDFLFVTYPLLRPWRQVVFEHSYKFCVWIHIEGLYIYIYIILYHIFLYYKLIVSCSIITLCKVQNWILRCYSLNNSNCNYTKIDDIEINYYIIL